MKEKQSYYFDYNATTPIDGEVYKEMIPYLTELYGNPSSSYYIGRQTKDKIEKTRYEIAQYFNMNPEGVYFTSCGSESDNMILKGKQVFFRFLISIICSAGHKNRQDYQI